MKKSIKALFTLTLSLSLALPLTAYAGTWIQDNTGWKVQSDEGVYLSNQWYQSPESKLWYYIGGDGYMLVDTITPDGFYVNADGVWIEQPVPETQTQVQNTQQSVPEQQLAPGALSIEEIERREAEAGLDGDIDVEIVREIHGDADAGRGYNWR